MRDCGPILRACLILVLCAMLLTPRAAFGQTLPAFDFTRAEVRQQWQPTHDIGALRAIPEGMSISISGGDPYTIGPARDYPPTQLLWLHIRLKSDQGGTGQVFYFADGSGPTEENSVRFPVRAGVWETLRVPMPALGPHYHLRLDPPGEHDGCIVASISFSPRTLLAEPAWPKPVPPHLGTDPLRVRSGEMEILHSRQEYGGFELRVSGRLMAVGATNPLIGYERSGTVRWLSLAGRAHVSALQEGNGITVVAKAPDADGAVWRLRQHFSPAKTPGAINVETAVTVSRDRTVVYLPMLFLLPGVGSFGTAKEHALFAGLEYLDRNEPSSSEADIIGPGSKRQTPDTLRITFPLMALQTEGRFVGFIWESSPRFCALFDSPDRHFASGGHLMGVLFPGSNGMNRVEGNLLPYEGEMLSGGRPLVSRATLIGGRGENVTSAVRSYVALRGLPGLPSTGETFQGYVEQAAHGWLQSKVRDGNRYRHAYSPGGSFQPQPIADGPLFMNWLARQTTDPDLDSRLIGAAHDALEQVPPADWNAAGVSHVRTPAPALVFGHVEESAERARAQARDLLGRFEPDGRVLYHKPAEGADLGRTHFAPDANGLTAQVVASLLESAAYCGDSDLIKQGLVRLRQLDRFMNSAPRGAQTWEVPLHTPDILASAYLVKAYTLGYELTYDRTLLDRAIYWAWTGVPFVYLVNPVQGPVGPYATIAVYGATQWVAPDWMGLPVQWCGLVYSAALYRLARHDAGGPWKQIADGITISGIQQSYPKEEPDLEGLLPDSFNLRQQTRNYPAINPGTVLANAIQLYSRSGICDFHYFAVTGHRVWAACRIEQPTEHNGVTAFTVKGWTGSPFYLLVTGLTREPLVHIDDKQVALTDPQEWHPDSGRLILKLEGSARHSIDIRIERRGTLRFR